MSGRLPAVSGRRLIRLLKARSFVQVRQSGSHAVLRHPDGRGTTVPIHANRDVGRGLLRQIMRDTGLTVDDLLAG